MATGDLVQDHPAASGGVPRLRPRRRGGEASPDPGTTGRDRGDERHAFVLPVSLVKPEGGVWAMESEHFRTAELRCHQCGREEFRRELPRVLDVLHAKEGPLKVNSVLRSPEQPAQARKPKPDSRFQGTSELSGRMATSLATFCLTSAIPASISIGRTRSSMIRGQLGCPTARQHLATELPFPGIPLAPPSSDPQGRRRAGPIRLSKQAVNECLLGLHYRSPPRQ